MEKLIRDISYYGMFSTGFILVLIRIFDPFYQFLIKRAIYEWFGTVIEEPEGGIRSEILSTFLSSSLNIELVYIILKGITKFSNNTEGLVQRNAANQD